MSCLASVFFAPQIHCPRMCCPERAQPHFEQYFRLFSLCLKSNLEPSRPLVDEYECVLAAAVFSHERVTKQCFRSRSSSVSCHLRAFSSLITFSTRGNHFVRYVLCNLGLTYRSKTGCGVARYHTHSLHLCITLFLLLLLTLASSRSCGCSGACERPGTDLNH